MKVAFANDHAALEAREIILDELRKRNIEVIDRGVSTSESVDYPDRAQAACRELNEKNVDRVVLVCGSGIGMSISANKVKGIRCALCIDEYSAEMSRRHNDANAIALRGREFDLERNRKILDVWLDTEFEGGRHQRRVDKMENPGDCGCR